MLQSECWSRVGEGLSVQREPVACVDLKGFPPLRESPGESRSELSAATAGICAPSLSSVQDTLLDLDVVQGSDSAQVASMTWQCFFMDSLLGFGTKKLVRTSCSCGIFYK